MAERKDIPPDREELGAGQELGPCEKSKGGRERHEGKTSDSRGREYSQHQTAPGLVRRLDSQAILKALWLSTAKYGSAAEYRAVGGACQFMQNV
jgi:hypothetical protein